MHDSEKSLRASLGDGACWSITAGFAEMIFTPFAIFLGATPFAAGLLTTLPPLLGDASQLTTNRLVHLLESRKKLILIATVLQALPLAALGSIALTQTSTFHSLTGYIFILVSAYWIFGMVQLPAWQSWMGDVVPEGSRGRFFALRNRIVAVVGFACLLSGGYLLDAFSRRSQTAKGFLLLLVLGLAGRLGSLFFLSRQDSVAEHPKETGPTSLFFFLKTIHRDRFGRFVLIIALFSFAMNVSSPYIVPFFLEELKLGYGAFMWLMGLLMAAKFLALPFWGRWSDARGHSKLFIAAIILCSLPPFFLLYSHATAALVAVQILGGIAMGGYELTAFNLLLEKTDPAARTRHAAYYQVLVGFAVVCGTLAGGLAFRYLAASMDAYHLNFWVSGVMRLGLVLAVITSRTVRL